MPSVPIVYVLAEDTSLAEQIAVPIRLAGYIVVHEGTVDVGDSVIADASRHVESGNPVVLCATAHLVGLEWTYRLVNAANASAVRLFALKMASNVLLNHLTLRGERIADYWQDPDAAVEDLLKALRKNFPIPPSQTVQNELLEVPDSPVGYLEQPVHGVDIDHNALQAFRDALREDRQDLRDLRLTPLEFLGRLRLTARGSTTRSAALLFSSDPVRYIPSAYAKFVQYFGEDKSADRDSQFVEGNAREQVDRLFESVRARIGRREKPGYESARASVEYAYPMKCVREIIVNAVVHRDYSDPTRHVHVQLFSDRLQVVSPGEWLGGHLESAKFSIGDLRTESVQRNPSLAHTMSLISYLEGEGSGLPTAVRDAREVGAPEPTVYLENGFVKVIIRPSRYDPGLVERIRNATLARQRPTAPASGSYRSEGVSPQLLVRPELTKARRNTAVRDRRQRFDVERILVSQSRAVVLLGPPGSGKTTALRLIAAAAAATSALPILIQLRHTAHARLMTVEDLVEWTAQHWAEDFGITVAPDSVAAVLEEVDVLLILDGLDELSSDYERKSVIRLIGVLLETYPKTQVLLGTRPAVMEELKDATVAWDRWEISPWSDSQLDEFLDRMSVAEGDPSLRFTFLEQLRVLPKTVKALCRTPLLAALTFDLFKRSGALPTARIDLLSDIASLLLTDWDAARGLESSKSSTRDLRSDLGELALVSLQAGKSLNSLEESWIPTALARGRGRLQDPDVAHRRGRQLIDYARRRGGLLSSSRGGDGFSYSLGPAPVAELLAAERLVQRASGSRAGPIDELSRWRSSDEVARLAGLMWASNSEEFPLELAEAVMSNEDDAESLPLWAALDAMVGELPLDARVRAEVRSKLRRYLSRGQAASRPARRIAESIAHRLDQQEA